MWMLPDDEAEPAAAIACAARRTLDILLALAGLVLLGPVILLLALAVRAESCGPAFYAQTRLGQHGRMFRLFKLRKFASGDTGGSALTARGDPRMTRVGRFLERTKLDELPQLWNILVGDMAVVGPRPESLALAHCFAASTLPVLEHRPGIFGPSQVVFRNENRLYRDGVDLQTFYSQVLFPLKAYADIRYFSHRRLASDLKWMVCGIAAVAGLSTLCCATLPSISDINRAIGLTGTAADAGGAGEPASAG